MRFPDCDSIVGSFRAVLMGWTAGAIGFALWLLVAIPVNRVSSVWEAVSNFPAFVVSCTFVMGFFVLPVWLFVCLPLYAFIPRRSVLWNPAVCTTLGALAGGAIFYDAFGFTMLDAMRWDFIVVAAITGAVTSFTATQNVKHFRGEQ